MKQHPGFSPASLHNSARLSLALGALLLSATACRSTLPKENLQAEWDSLVGVNPTDIAVSAVPSDGLPKELRPSILREAMRDAMLVHRYSPLAFEYVDGGQALEASNGRADAGPPVVRLDLAITAFESAGYTFSNRIRVAGKFLFTDTRTSQTLATVHADIPVDLSTEYRRQVPLDEAVRIAARQFVLTALEPMPLRRIEPAK